MNILLLYATNSGSTQMAAQCVYEELTSLGNVVRMTQVHEVPQEELSNFDAIILGSPSWDFNGKEGQPHEDYAPFIKNVSASSYDGKKFAIFGLGDSSYTHFCGAVDVLEDLIKNIKATLIIPSIRIDGYYYNLQNNNETLRTWARNLHSQLTGS